MTDHLRVEAAFPDPRIGRMEGRAADPQEPPSNDDGDGGADQGVSAEASGLRVYSAVRDSVGGRPTGVVGHDPGYPQRQRTGVVESAAPSDLLSADSFFVMSFKGAAGVTGTGWWTPTAPTRSASCMSRSSRRPRWRCCGTSLSVGTRS